MNNSREDSQKHTNIENVKRVPNTLHPVNTIVKQSTTLNRTVVAGMYQLWCGRQTFSSQSKIGETRDTVVVDSRLACTNPAL